MAGRRQLGFPKTSACSLREQLARTTLRNVRLQGHTYVELREDGKRFIFFCTLCLAPCYSDSVLFDHLKGNLHNERYAAAKVTLLKPNPWLFNDGVLFFHDLSEKDKHLPISNANQIGLLENRNEDDNDLAVVIHGENSRHTSNGHDEIGCTKNVDPTRVDTDCDSRSCDKNLNGNEGYSNLVIPGVLRKDEILDLEVRFMGVGQIAARIFEKDGVLNGISRIWCEWLGKKDSGNEDTLMVQEHDFAVITFAYNYDLGRKGLFEDVRYLLTSRPWSEIGDIEGARKKRRKSFSDPEDISESLSNQYDSSGEESQSSNSSYSRLLLDGYDDELLHSRFILSKTIRRELRRQQRVAAERMCDICQQKMLPGKDVATLLNTKTGRLTCSSRNVNGAFHIFHISCLIHWILLCEFEISTKQSTGPKVKRRSRRKSGTKCNEIGKESELGTTRKQIYSVFCPECQGTGIKVEGDELEKPTVPLSEVCT
uniref:C2H2-type domain-containing protein n=1 Tax=Davidia involucrata TaxID=16924 RepID=A0A5B7AZC3_DAVIN